MAEATNHRRGWEDPDTAIELRKLFLKEGATIITEMCRIAKTGIPDNPNVKESDRRFMFESLLPMIHSAKDGVRIDKLGSMTPEERANAILEAVGVGDISPQDALNIVQVLTALNGDGGEDTSQQLVINIQSSPDSTLVGQVIDSNVEIPTQIG